MSVKFTPTNVKTVITSLIITAIFFGVFYAIGRGIDADTYGFVFGIGFLGGLFSNKVEINF